MNGNIFVFEGPDGVGKSTLAEVFRAYLEENGKKPILLGFPGNEPGTLGKFVYDFHHAPQAFNVKEVNSTSLQLMHIAAHIDAIVNTISPKLQAGYDVILDRYWWSTWVYGLTSGVDQMVLDQMIEVEKYFWKDQLPKLIFLIDRAVPLREGIDQKAWNQLRKYYTKLFELEKSGVDIRRIPNENTVNVAFSEILRHFSLSIEKNRKNKEEFNQLSFIEKSNDRGKGTIYFYSKLSPVEPTVVYDSYWYFATERQNVFFRKYWDESEPWTDDPILATYKFTNAYRASDRVSQYLIKNVIYNNEFDDPQDIFFRIILFKFFNKISTWEILERHLGEITYKDFDFNRYDQILAEEIKKASIFSAAYIMPSGTRVFGESKKHRNLLILLQTMMADALPEKIQACKSMQAVFNLIKSYPMMGDFLAYQYAIDLNYSTLTNFSESEFVIPGPGARDGIKKCFSDFGGLNEMDIIKLVRDRQEMEFEKLGLDFKSLWGRPLQLIDCQNLFCETDKYARVAHPDIQGHSKRSRIKQKYSPKMKGLNYWYPPKWGINHLIKERNHDQSLRRDDS